MENDQCGLSLRLTKVTMILKTSFSRISEQYVTGSSKLDYMALECVHEMLSLLRFLNLVMTLLCVCDVQQGRDK